MFLIKTHRNPGLRVFLLLFLLIAGQCLTTTELLAKSNQPDYYELIIQRIQRQNNSVPIKQVDNKTETYLAKIESDGRFNDINYQSRSQTLWEPIKHLERMKAFVLSYAHKNGRYYGNQDLFNFIVKSLDYWYTQHPTSTNWWYQKISAPQQMGELLILMRSGKEQIPEELEKKLLERMRTEGDRPDLKGSQGTGANKLDIATHWIYRGVLTKDESVLQFGVDQVYYPLFITKKEGLQEDFSYHQHGNQLHVGGYGTVFIKGIASIAANMVETPYALPKDRLDLLSGFVRKAYIPMVRGQYFMYNVIGRSVSREDGLNQKNFVDVLELMTQIDKSHKEEYKLAISRLTGSQPASYKIEPRNTWYYRSDYTLHQRPSYAFDVRGSTVNTARSENGNKENLKGYFLCDGAYSLVKEGNEYENIFAVWDWSRIPGTTTPVMPNIPLPRAWENPGTSLFSATASDGIYGVTAYLYNDTNYHINTSAKKAWFMFDDQIVALGTDISSTSEFPINTTLEQNLSEGAFIVKSRKDGVKSVDRGGYTSSDIDWVLNGKTAYYLLESASLSITNQEEHGSWHQINNSVTDKPYSKNVFKMWIDHGVQPVDASYSYVILPNVDSPKQIEKMVQPIEIIRNDSEIQAVYHKDLDMLGVVAYRTAHFAYGSIVRDITKPTILLYKHISTKDKMELIVYEN